MGRTHTGVGEKCEELLRTDHNPPSPPPYAALDGEGGRWVRNEGLKRSLGRSGRGWGEHVGSICLCFLPHKYIL